MSIHTGMSIHPNYWDVEPFAYFSNSSRFLTLKNMFQELHKWHPIQLLRYLKQSDYVGEEKLCKERKENQKKKQNMQTIEGSSFSGRVQEEKRKSIDNMFCINHPYQVSFMVLLKHINHLSQKNLVAATKHP